MNECLKLNLDPKSTFCLAPILKIYLSFEDQLIIIGNVVLVRALVLKENHKAYWKHHFHKK